MKKALVLLMAVLLCMSMVLPVFAAENEFVPSVTVKDGVEDEEATMGGESVGECVIVTSIREAKEKTTDIFQEDRDLLLDVYEKLADGSMKLPSEEDLTIVELVDVSWAASACVGAQHGHKEELAKEGVTIEVTFKLDVDPNAEVTVFAYINGEWVQVKVTVNGDGTITCEFEDFCPVAFCVEGDALEEAPATGDNTNVFLWLAVMLAAAAALVVVLVSNRRRTAK